MTEHNWGAITPELADLSNNTFVYVYNHDMTSIAKIDRTIRFILGRVFFYDKQLPKDSSHKLVLDVRGQNIGEEICHMITQEINQKYNQSNSLEIEFIK